MVRRASCLIAVVGWSALSAVVAGCSDSSDRATNEDPGVVVPIAPLPSTCAEPDEPAALGRDVVVGDGSAASCTNEALQAAATEGGDIRFDCGAEPVTIVIGTEVRVAADAIIDGGSLVTLDGQGVSRLLLAESHVQLAVKNLTFVRGRSAPTDEGPNSGGAIRGGWSGSLDVRDCTFTDNEAGTTGEEGGGAVYTPSATTMTIARSSFTGNRGGTGGAVHNLLSGLTIVSSTFIDNESVTGGGGAVYTDGASTETEDEIGGTIDICGCRFEQNRGAIQGGAAYLFAYSPDNIVINQCSFTDNFVGRGSGDGALGGALRPGNAPMDVGNCLFARNTAEVHGGAIRVDGHYPSRISSSTFVDNLAGVDGVADAGYGGAISGRNLVLNNLTFVGNRAVYSGGALFNEDEVSTMHNSILRDNVAGNEWGLSQSCHGALVGNHNLQWPDPATGSGEDVVCAAETLLTDPLLGELADNGGPTWTVALGAASPAIDAGEGCTELDQRGEPRNGPCDLGAYERR